MRRVPSTLLALSSALVAFAVGCRPAPAPDAYGNFEATEVVVSAQGTGQLLWFQPVEGGRIDAGALVGVIDTAQLALQQRQLLAQKAATGSRATEATRQIGVLKAQRDVARRAYERTRRLADQQAATAQQLDQAERDYRVLLAQIEAARAQRQSVSDDVAGADAHVAQTRLEVEHSRIVNPVGGTVLATFARTGERVQPGQPLYKIASLDTLVLRAYVTEAQLAGIRLGQQVTVHVDRGTSTLLSRAGTVSWIAAKAEFTPTPVQTRDERAALVYAMKVLVPNPDGALKIGMPADLALSPHG